MHKHKKDSLNTHLKIATKISDKLSEMRYRWLCPSSTKGKNNNLSDIPDVCQIGEMF